MNSPTFAHIPNWQRWVDMYHPDDALVEAFIHRIDGIEDPTIRERVSGYINLELGILLLAHREIDHKKMGEILSVTRTEGENKN